MLMTNCDGIVTINMLVLGTCWMTMYNNMIHIYIYINNVFLGDSSHQQEHKHPHSLKVASIGLISRSETDPPTNI